MASTTSFNKATDFNLLTTALTNYHSCFESRVEERFRSLGLALVPGNRNNLLCAISDRVAKMEMIFLLIWSENIIGYSSETAPQHEALCIKYTQSPIILSKCKLTCSTNAPESLL